MAMRDDARRIFDDLPDEDMPVVLHMLASMRGRQQKLRVSDLLSPEREAALSHLTASSQEIGLYEINRIPENWQRL
jgi:hypothetical protein